MWLHEHTWAALVCRPNSCVYQRYITLTNTECLNHVGVTTMKVISILHYRSRNWHVLTGNWTRASTVGGEHCRKEPFEELVNSYSEHLDMNPRQIQVFAGDLPAFSFSYNFLRLILSWRYSGRHVVCVRPKAEQLVTGWEEQRAPPHPHPPSCFVVM